MPDIASRNFDDPETTRMFANGKMDVVTVGGVTYGMARFQPGWRWANDVKPIAKTDSCQTHHRGVILSGTMVVRMDDGTETTLRASDAVEIPAGHDAWIEGDEECVYLEISGAQTYAKPA